MADRRLWAPRTHAGKRVPSAWVGLLQVHAELIRRMNSNLLASHDLTISDYEVLLHLSWAPEGRLSRSQIAEAVHLTHGGITRLLHGLEQAGLVRSRSGETDRRIVYAALTDAGHQRLREAAQTHVADITATFTSRLSTEELATLGALLGRLTEPREDPGAGPRPRSIGPQLPAAGRGRP